MKSEIIIFALLIAVLFWGTVGLCILILKSFPHSKLSGWIRRHIITDEDLEP